MLKALRVFSLLALAAYYSPLTAYCQVTGGQHAFEFLRLPQSPHISALGSINVANGSNDVSLAVQNPSLMRPGLHNQLQLAYNNYYAGISVTNLQYGYHVETLQTSFVLGLQHVGYGDLTRTDAVGNATGTFTARDVALTLGASRQYLERWRYGATLKFASSVLDDKSAIGLLTDVGVTYYDTSNGITVGIVAKNMGVMLDKYNPDNSTEPLPFDLQLGFSKRFAHLPLRFNATAHHLYEWDVRYNNPADVEAANLFGTPDTTAREKRYIADKVFRHLIFGADILIGKRITVTAAYNHLRRGELALQERTALAGFSFGATVDLNKLQVQYARNYFHLAGATNEFGLNLALGRLVGLGKGGEKIGWKNQYQDWSM